MTEAFISAKNKTKALYNAFFNYLESFTDDEKCQIVTATANELMAIGGTQNIFASELILVHATQHYMADVTDTNYKALVYYALGQLYELHLEGFVKAYTYYEKYVLNNTINDGSHSILLRAIILRDNFTYSEELENHYKNSLCEYATNPIINIVTSLLIVTGGIGYIVWWDFIRVAKMYKTHGINCFKKLTLQSKIAISMTTLLIFAGGVLYFIFEYNNPLTIGNYNLFDKIQVSLFQSVTTRTAGFATIAQENFTNSSAILSLLLMFIGGSPVGTAGGVKTVTIAVLVITAFSLVRDKNEITIFNRAISQKAVKKSVAVVGTSFVIMFISTIMLSLVTDASVIDILYETVSATATVGLTRNLTPSLNMLGKLIIIVTMYFGRIGPITLAIALNTKKEKQNIVKTPYEDISVG